MLEMQLDSLAGLFLLAVSRLGGLMLGFPIFGFETAPKKARLALALCLGISMMPAVANYYQGYPTAPILLNELLIGFVLGVILRCMIAVAEIVGEFAGIQLGFGFQKTMNPLSREQNGPVTGLLFSAVAVLVFATELHHDIIRSLAGSYESIPLGGTNYQGDLIFIAKDLGSDMFMSGLRLALPLIVVGLITQVCFGVFTKFAPQMNVFSMGFAFMIIIGLWGLNLTIPGMLEQLRSKMESGVFYTLSAGG